MSAITFERHITRFEVTNQCILVEDDKGDQHGVKLGTQVIILAGNKEYKASLRDFYIKGKFKSGLAFEKKEGTVCEFFFDQSVSESKRVQFEYDPNESERDGCSLIKLNIYVVTKK